jgi:hypothetical protein
MVKLALDPNGRTVVGGDVTIYQNTILGGYLYRLNNDGTDANEKRFY